MMEGHGGTAFTLVGAQRPPAVKVNREAALATGTQLERPSDKGLTRALVGRPDCMREDLMFKIISKIAAKSSTQPEIRELNDAELDAVAGGLTAVLIPGPLVPIPLERQKEPIGLTRYQSNHNDALPPGLDSLISAGHTPPGLDRG
ncbi:hypothetical protein ACRAWG_35280 [Methylobacterium sp. P31]